jgi:hypothetical protein
VKNNGIKHIRSEPLNDLFKHSNKGCVLQNATSQFEASSLRTKLDVLKADVRKRVEDKQVNEAVKKSQNPAPNFEIGQNVIAMNYRGGDKWVQGIIAAQTGPLSYQVRVASSNRCESTHTRRTTRTYTKARS